MMGSTKQILFDAFAFGSGHMQWMQDKKAKSRAEGRRIEVEKRSARNDALLKLGGLQQGRSIKGQAGDGSLLTGAGGLSDPVITGKSTLLGSK